jgi:sugar lactone lactonase YvrE
MREQNDLTAQSSNATRLEYIETWVSGLESGKRISHIDLPVQCPTSCAFGGRHLDELYITSAWEELNGELRAAHPLAGDLFRMKTSNTGLRQPLFMG